MEVTPAESTVATVSRPPLNSQVSTLWQRKQNAVCVRRACKRYGTNSNPHVVLENLNMTVPKGSIYGLLGASGCGKTTLLTCIIGRRRLNTGEIWVLGGKPGQPGTGVPGPRVGYMPQDIALNGEFSISETLMYFGWIFGLDTEKIEERLTFLLKFLELPSKNRLVKTLSGGQQRRVSLAAALVHDPELLILDEPTVGVDPVLRQNIWEHLIAITKDGNKTVIITTHYIEEARQAHAIGLMRGGRLLAEQSPDNMLINFGCDSLEEVFLKLSREQTKNQQNSIEAASSAHSVPIAGGPMEASVDPVVENKEVSPQEEEDFTYKQDESPQSSWKKNLKLSSANIFKALLWKNFMWFWRNPGIILFVVGLPIIQVVLFCTAVGRDPAGLTLAVVNHDQAMGMPCPKDLSGCNLTHMACRYLDHLGEFPVVQELFPDVESAQEAVRKGHAWGALYFTDNYTDALVARAALWKDADNETLDQSEMRVWLDLSNKHIGLMLQRYLHQSYTSFMKDLLTACNENTELVEVPVKFLKPIYGPAVPNFTDFAAPGVMLTIIFFLAVALMSGAMIIERVEGLLERSLVCGITPLEILASHVVTQFVVMTVQCGLVILFTLTIFKITCEGPIYLVAIMLLLQGLCGMCFGMVISCLCENERTATYLGLGSFLPIVMLCGIIWPVEGMNYYLRTMSSILPLTYPTESMRSILARGWTMEQPVVYHGFITILVWVLVFSSASVIILKFRKG
ncbi:ABC transporter G family member 23-like [Neocloeon triangulifer]|uniref:ABC transporter G family member 23-like n=1 Tax=Neocloeon triangulifer TaxID=2078957 RepID=UPI00286ED2BB|nr:ABC transporter G family member 23-like [Neocloeon triangulifer]